MMNKLRLVYGKSRDAMYIDGFGERIIEDFYNMGYLKTIVDFYELKKVTLCQD